MNIEFKRKELLGMLTSNNSTNRTDRWVVNGTDLGYPVYDQNKDVLYLLFGDSFCVAEFKKPDNTKPGNTEWRSQTMAIIDNFKKQGSSLFNINRFYGREDYAEELMHSLKQDGLEMTRIPTGGIVHNGDLYVFFFSMQCWAYMNRLKMNMGGLYVLKQGEKEFRRVTDMTFLNLPHNYPNKIKQMASVTENKEFTYEIDFDKHANPNFTEIFPYEEGEYIYLYAQGAYRESGLYLARILKKDFPSYDAIEYYCGLDKNNDPIYIKGQEGIKNEKTIAKDIKGEFSMCKYKGKYLFFVQQYNVPRGKLMLYQANSLYGPFTKSVLLKNKDPLLSPLPSCYAPLTNSVLANEKEGYIDLIVSLWLPVYNPKVIRLYEE